MKTVRHIFSLLALVLLCGSCAKVVTPTGGPRDSAPPKVLKSTPDNQSVNFGEKQIHITLDEFFTLNNPQENVMISPPLKEKPTYTVKGKTLVVKFKDTLRANTTYNMVFTNCIQDYNEGNPLSLFHYSFSTGPVIDSFMLEGSIQNASSLTPAEDLLVMLYHQNIDSLPLSALPDYVTKSQKNSSFQFRNIAPGDYKIFALKDINGNYIYDLPNEEIAYQKELVSAVPPPATDSSGNPLSADSTVAKILLHSFLSQDSFPKLMRYENPAAGIYKFPFSTPVSHLEQQPLWGPADHIEVWNQGRDTLTWYLKKTDFDTLAVIFIADSHTDTVHLKPFKAKPNTGRGGGAQNTLRSTFLNEGHCYQPLILRFSYPIQPIDSFPVYIYSQRQGKNDTATVWIPLPKDTALTEIAIPYPFETKKHYKVMIPDSLFFGYNGLVNDTLRTSFSYKSEKDYGNIQIHYQVGECGYPVIVQLLSGNTTLQQDILTGDATKDYNHLEPGPYTIRAILDRNGNGRWDSGDYRKGVQPETIIPFSHDINVRAFWDVEEDFKIDTSK